MKKIILILSAVLLLVSCEKHYYDPVVQVKEYEGMIAQEGEVIMIDYVYTEVETKFTQPTACLTFRYRAFIDDEIYSYAIVTGSSNPPLKIVVPCNDTFSERNVKVEISAGKTYDRYPEEWGEWQEVFSATQACLAEGASQTTTELADKKVGKLSGGETRRVAICRGFCVEAPLVLLDEPFTALDSVTKEALLTLVCRLVKEQQKTAVMVTHDVDEAIAIADRVAVMAAGKIVFCADLPQTDSVRPYGVLPAERERLISSIKLN
jgi:energy-coupling factor transporter ATP-binding protein EcfA2